MATPEAATLGAAGISAGSSLVGGAGGQGAQGKQHMAGGRPGGGR